MSGHPVSLRTDGMSGGEIENNRTEGVEAAAGIGIGYASWLPKGFGWIQRYRTQRRYGWQYWRREQYTTVHVHSPLTFTSCTSASNLMLSYLSLNRETSIFLRAHLALALHFVCEVFHSEDVLLLRTGLHSYQRSFVTIRSSY